MAKSCVMLPREVQIAHLKVGVATPESPVYVSIILVDFVDRVCVARGEEVVAVSELVESVGVSANQSAGPPRYIRSKLSRGY